MADLLSHGITPVVREYGSLGCSGDLAPAVALRARADGRGRRARTPTGTLVPAAEALAAAGLEPVELVAKEGLALINGTDGMLGMLVMAITDLRMLLRTADVAAAMSVEAQLGTDRVFARRAAGHPSAPRPGAVGGQPHRADGRLGDRRLAPHGAGNRWSATACRTPTRCAARRRCTARPATPSSTPRRSPAASWPAPSTTRSWCGDRVESNGNFHGAPVGYVLDFLAIVAADVASISERRTDRFLDRARNHGLPPFLADDPGVDSGHMIAQYTQASIVSELKRLAVPASVDSIPSSAMQEDHVSMGWNAARKLRRSVDGLARVVAVEVLTAARALDLRAPLTPSPATGAVVDLLRSLRHRGSGPRPPPLARDRGRRRPRPVRRGPRRRLVRDRRTPVNAPQPPPAHPRRARHRAVREVVADRGAAAHADEQPRPRQRRAPRGPRRLRRHRQGGAQLGGVRRDRALAARPRGRRDAARAVGQAGRHHADARSGRRAC